jgi:hypothetical protein
LLFSAAVSGAKLVTVYIIDAPKFSFRWVQCRESERLQGQSAQLA